MKASNSVKNPTQKLLTGILVLQGLLLAGQWLGQPSIASARADALPNPSERQMQMVDELKQLNAKVDKLSSMLANGEVTVKVAKEEK
jgi:hypothetical protein